MNQIPYRRPEGDPRAGEVADLVRLIGLNRLELLPYRARFPELTGIVKDPWNARRPAPDLHAVMAALPVMDTISVRLDGRLTTDLAEAPFGRARRTAQGEIVFTRGRRTTGRIAGPPDLLDLLEPLLRGAEDPHAVLLPKDPDALHELVSHDLAEIARLLDGGRRMVERVERLVCALYGIPDDLTEEVVRHASDRAGERSDNPIDEG